MSEPVQPSPRSERRRSRSESYVLPRDLLEGNRLELQHHVFRHALKSDFAAPIEAASWILDVGSGTGVWGEQAALDFPEAEVVDLDLEPPEQTVLSATAGTARPAPNHHFVQGSVLGGLPFPDHLFDLTHQRMVLGPAIPNADWIEVIRELVRVTRPGGWVELLGRRGLGFEPVKRLGALAEEAGLRAVRFQIVDLPLGDWEPYVGVLLGKDYLSVIEALEPVICQALQVPPAAYAGMLAQVPSEWVANHVSAPFALVYGQAG
jgi:SAM-dependent methyltransferase